MLASDQFAFSHTDIHFNINGMPFCFTLAIDKEGLMELLLLLPNVRHKHLKVISTVQVGPSTEIRQKR